MSRRKNKQSRKYIPVSEFRYNNSPLANGHPHYVFGITRNGRKFKSIGVTTHPKKGYRVYRLSTNPNSEDNKNISYVQDRVHTARKDYYEQPLPNWYFSKEDMSIIRHIIKKYKKNTNRHRKKKNN